MISGIFFGTLAVILIFSALYLSYGFYKKININNDELIDYSMNEMEINSLQETLFNLKNKKKEIENKLKLIKQPQKSINCCKSLSDLAFRWTYFLVNTKVVNIPQRQALNEL